MRFCCGVVVSAWRHRRPGLEITKRQLVHTMAARIRKWIGPLGIVCSGAYPRKFVRPVSQPWPESLRHSSFGCFLARSRNAFTEAKPDRATIGLFAWVGQGQSELGDRAKSRPIQGDGGDSRDESVPALCPPQSQL